MKKRAICTIASKNYLAQVRVFAKSAASSNPDIPIYALITDRPDMNFDPALEPYHVILAEELDNIPHVEELYFKYEQIELNTAIKPYFLEYILKRYDLDGVCFFDPDIYVFSGLSEIWKTLEEWSLALTPHILSPYPDDGLHPTEKEINLAGIFNLGFIGLSKTPTTVQFLQWWKSRLFDYCYLKPGQGMHVDQNWVNFAPVMHEDVRILRDPACNIAYWNLHERAADLVYANGQWMLGQRPVIFFHYSGFDPENPDKISTHQNRYTMDDFPNIRAMYRFYADRLKEEDHSRISQWSYTHGYFDNGVKIPKVARTLYARVAKESRDSFGNPFSTAADNSYFSWLNSPAGDPVSSCVPVITHLQLELYRSRPELRLVFPDPLGANRLQFVQWLKKKAFKHGNIPPVFAPTSVVSAPFRPMIHLRTMRCSLAKNLSFMIHGLAATTKCLFSGQSSGLQKQKKHNPHYSTDYHGLAHPCLPSSPPRKHPLPFGVNVAGYIQGEFGVAEAARASLKSLAAAQVPHVLNNIKTDAYREKDPTFSDFSKDNPYRVNLMHVNADQMPIIAKEMGPAYFRDRYNIACWFWELSTFPKKWGPSFAGLNEIWVASGFCQESIARSSPIPVVKLHLPILIERNHVRPDRECFGLPPEPFIFGFVFDFHSFSERKNPLGLIRAFERAFEDRKDVLLVIKSINGQLVPQKLKELTDYVHHRNLNVHFIDEYLPRQSAINLVATFDCFVSLHRSEGLGIGMAQAMYLKKPVIATGYSGNMEYMNQNNSFLVRYKLAELQDQHGPYEQGQVWADPDLDHAAMLMRQVFDNQVVAKQVGQRAFLDIQMKMTPEVTGRAMKERLLLISS